MYSEGKPPSYVRIRVLAKPSASGFLPGSVDDANSPPVAAERVKEENEEGRSSPAAHAVSSGSLKGGEPGLGSLLRTEARAGRRSDRHAKPWSPRPPQQGRREEAVRRLPVTWALRRCPRETVPLSPQGGEHRLAFAKAFLILVRRCSTRSNSPAGPPTSPLTQHLRPGRRQTGQPLSGGGVTTESAPSILRRGSTAPIANLRRETPPPAL